MIEACDALSEPDLVLSIAAPVARAGIGPPPPIPPNPHVAPPSDLQPPPVPGALPPPTSAAAACPTIVEADERPASGIWPDRDWWVSTGVSLVIHVVVLTVLALLVPLAEPVMRPRPIEILQDVVEPEQVPFEQPDELLAVEVLPPEPDEPVDVPLEPAHALAGNDAAEEALDAGDAAVDGVVAIDADAALARIGGAGAAGRLDGDVGRRLARAGAKSGDIQVSLSWDNFNDLDIHVLAPSGEHIFFAHRQSRCRGTLDVDMNASGAVTREPVENIFWPARTAPLGEYQIFVHYYGRHDEADETAFNVDVLVNGTRRRYSGSVRAGQPAVPVARFERDATSGPARDVFVE